RPGPVGRLTPARRRRRGRAGAGARQARRAPRLTPRPRVASGRAEVLGEEERQEVGLVAPVAGDAVVAGRLVEADRLGLADAGLEADPPVAERDRLGLQRRQQRPADPPPAGL